MITADDYPIVLNPLSGSINYRVKNTQPTSMGLPLDISVIIILAPTAVTDETMGTSILEVACAVT